MNPLRAAIVRGVKRSGRRGDGVRAPRRGDGYEFAQLRSYVEGDDPRHVDWAASARIGALQTRVYLEETALILAAFVDESPSMQVGRVRRLSTAADEALRSWFGAAEHDDRARRIVDERVVEGIPAAIHVTARTPFSLQRTLEVAARVLPRGASLLAITDGFDLPAHDDGTLDQLGARCDATVLLARDPWADDLPLRGFRRMRDSETGRARLLYFGRRERARFLAAVATRERSLHERFARAGWRVGVLDARDGRASLERAFGVR